MSHLHGWLITCPHCGHQANGDAFEPSLADECWCPVCHEGFLFEAPDDDEEEFEPITG